MAPDSKLNAPAFIYCSLLELGYVSVKGDVRGVYADIARIREVVKDTKTADKGIRLVIDAGLVMDEGARLLLGYAQSVFGFSPLCDIVAIEGNSDENSFGNDNSKAAPCVTTAAYGYLLLTVTPVYENYKDALVGTPKVGLADKIMDKIKSLFLYAERTGEVKPYTLYTFLNLLNAMVYRYSSVPNIRGTAKELGQCATFLKFVEGIEALKATAFFCANIDSIAKGNNKDANLNNLLYYRNVIIKAYDAVPAVSGKKQYDSNGNNEF